MQFITLGLVLGFSAGITPGPLLALVLAESLRHGPLAGMKMAVAPVASDLPIVLLIFWATAHISHITPLLGILSLLGGGMLLFLGLQNFRVRGLTLDGYDSAPHSFSKGVAVNILNPHPYLFWFTVGAPIANRAMTLHWGWLPVFLGCFYFAFVAIKFILAVLAGRSRRRIGDTAYRYTMWFIGAALCLLALLFFREGLNLLV